MPFLKNVWYVGATATELDSGKPVSRRICDERIVFYKKSDGAVVALEDRCPHRFVRLSLGRVEGDELRCLYHGLKFDSTGACTEIPVDPEADRSRICVKSYPAVSRYGVVWLWMGDHAKADPAKIPDFSFITDPNYAVVDGYLNVKGHHEFITDNLLDLSHVAFLHPEVGYDSDVDNWVNKVEQDGDTVWSMLWRPNYKPGLFQAKLWNSTSERADGQAHVRWNAPSVLLALTALNEVGLPPDQGCSVPSAHLLTPETLTSTHYFWFAGRNTCLDDKELSQLMQSSVGRIFATQDGPMVESEQETLGEDVDFLAHKPLILKADAAGVRARRVLKKLIKEEREAEAAASGHIAVAK